MPLSYWKKEEKEKHPNLRARGSLLSAGACRLRGDGLVYSPLFVTALYPNTLNLETMITCFVLREDLDSPFNSD